LINSYGKNLKQTGIYSEKYSNELYVARKTMLVNSNCWEKGFTSYKLKKGQLYKSGLFIFFLNVLIERSISFLGHQGIF